MIGINGNGNEVAYTIVKQVREKLALLTIKNTEPKTTRFFLHYFLVSVEPTSISSIHLENPLRFSCLLPEPFVIMLIGIKFLLPLITSVISSVLCHASSGNSIMNLLFWVL